jgi:type 1 glutamine amidotransferase
VWVNQNGKIRSFSTTLGHGNEVVETKEYLDLVARGILWVTGKLKEDGTAAEGFGPANP